MVWDAETGEALHEFEHEGIVGSMAGFKQHVSFGFWRGGEPEDPAGMFQKVGNSNLSQVKVAGIAELAEDDVLRDYIRRAVDLNRALAAGEKPRANPMRGGRKSTRRAAGVSG